MEDFDIQVFQTKIKSFVNCIVLLSSKEQVTHPKGGLERIELGDSDLSNFKVYLFWEYINSVPSGPMQFAKHNESSCFRAKQSVQRTEF